MAVEYSSQGYDTMEDFARGSCTNRASSSSESDDASPEMKDVFCDGLIEMPSPLLTERRGNLWARGDDGAKVGEPSKVDVGASDGIEPAVTAWRRAEEVRIHRNEIEFVDEVEMIVKVETCLAVWSLLRDHWHQHMSQLAYGVI
ncbi:hypothetical protein M7I_6965 [Glarea lozoyensis 74030]|uniref:Uncharacterized protein n=1 Tax=Glarea lozoyensis (strain ATCC 74030 / MF5533) TaxID=1104152 RepID=H0EW07_GLAL7|nr:hypothetical protein M7I_6965 [Glarea lozoyensis 74030]